VFRSCRGQSLWFEGSGLGVKGEGLGVRGWGGGVRGLGSAPELADLHNVAFEVGC
jgi:hypothetical protein